VGWGIDWIELTQNRDKWRALVKAVMDFKAIQFVILLYRSTLFVTPSKLTVLIHTDTKGVSATCFGTSAPSCGRTKYKVVNNFCSLKIKYFEDGTPVPGRVAHGPS